MCGLGGDLIEPYSFGVFIACILSGFGVTGRADDANPAWPTRRNRPKFP